MAQSESESENPSADGIEYRSGDDAWYDVNASLHGELLNIKYSMLSASPHEELHDAKTFKSLDDVARFRNRFRPLSAQLQDSECRSVVPGVKVCASYRAVEDDLRYYDAVVEQVNHNEHSYKNGKEQCLCKFILFWKHGPSAGYLTTATVEDICLLTNGETNEKLAEFIEMARGMVISSSMSSGNLEASDGDLNPESQSINVQNEDSYEPRNQDADLGGEVMTLKKFLTSGYSYAVSVDNLEKDLTPSTVTKFILKETTINSQAYIFPSLLPDMYTRGVIEVNSREDFIRLNDFLENRNHIIVSSHNRPWVITERLWKGEPRTIMQTSGVQQTHSAKSCSELKIVHSGMPEYDMAKQFKENFTELCSHKKCMVKRLAFEEHRINSRWTVN